MTFQQFEEFQSSARKQGYKNATRQAIEKFIEQTSLNRLPRDRVQALAAVVHEYYENSRDRGYSREEAWARCELFMKERERLESRRKASLFEQARKPLASMSPSSSFFNLKGMKDTLPSGGRNLCRTEERRPSGQHWARGEFEPFEDILRDTQANPSQADSSRGASYHTEERRPSGGGSSYSYSYTYSESSTTGSNTPPAYSARGTYKTKEFRPEGSSQSQSTREDRPSGNSTRPPPRAFRPFGTDDARSARAAYESRYDYQTRSAPPPRAAFPPPPPPPPPPPATNTADPYIILGVSRSASAEEINKAYKKLSLKYHPDKVPAADREKATKKFQEIVNAKETLMDAKKRAAYDKKFRR